MENKKPNIAHWLKVWSYQLALIKWSVTQKETPDYHAIMPFTAMLQIEPVLKFEEAFKDAFDQFFGADVAKNNENVSTMMELTLLVCSQVDVPALRKEANDIVKDMLVDFGTIGVVEINLSSPLRLFTFLHRIHAVEISANIQAYAPEAHNPVNGFYKDSLEAMLARMQKEAKEPTEGAS